MVNSYEHSFLKKWNADVTDAGTKVMSSEAAMGQDKITIPKQIRFNPPLTKYSYHQARILYHMYNHGAGARPEVKHYKWKFSGINLLYDIFEVNPIPSIMIGPGVMHVNFRMSHYFCTFHHYKNKNIILTTKLPLGVV